ncbi:hypothetical protein [Halococcus sp. AFM35]|uniref:hypothetical protein n=1 Tax=Halococcus sp. AFM35 TaxID=3421653 RepID=UPI003EBEEFDD
MSDVVAAPEEMTRDELEAYVRDLESDVENLNESTSAMRNELAFIKRTLVVLTDAEIGGEHHPLEGLPEAGEQTRGDIEDIQTAVESHGETLATIADVESEKSSEGEKIGAIVAYADQARGGMAKALVTPKEIAGATGCSKRYAYDLVDKIGGADEDVSGFDEGQYPWAAVREATTVPTSTGTEQKPKALKIDFDRVQRNPGALNWFNNGNGGEGGE